jgi:low affinity Fe/Cu permease
MAARAAGSPAAFLIATTFIVVWAATGPAFGYSDTWQLVINTATTIITFLMVFLIQNTQNRDTMALQVKLAELIIAMKGAENRIAAVEELSDQELERLHNDLSARAQATSDALNVRRGKKRHVR